MSDLTISAKLVAAGVGLPPIWWRAGDEQHAPAGWAFRYQGWHGGSLVELADPQTAFGLAGDLDEWERARDPCWPNDGMGWAVELAFAIRDKNVSHTALLLADMIARLEHIGRDAEIRRALGWEVEPCTLATLARGGTHLDTSGWYFGTDRDKPRAFALPSSADRTEALRLIYAAVCL